ncbi:unnamed protein product [Acanthoscelides obtectus]|nr:unnamed protein product [Acanthoscelides obtectus]CAK1681698.1 hypothetical protein AOBTE_LOCUS33226 [Acanthoscelides obtectus]
MNRSTH